jgi:hypothetical protein
MHACLPVAAILNSAVLIHKSFMAELYEFYRDKTLLLSYKSFSFNDSVKSAILRDFLRWSDLVVGYGGAVVLVDPSAVIDRRADAAPCRPPCPTCACTAVALQIQTE